MNVAWYLARMAQQSASPDPRAFENVTLSQLDALYGKKADGRGPPPRAAELAESGPQVQSYEAVLRAHFRARGESPEQVERLVREQLKAGK